jgi:hypothetical protein
LISLELEESFLVMARDHSSLVVASRRFKR